jgi:DNA-binding NtrC family response regulator
VAIQEFDFASGKTLDPNRRQAIVLSKEKSDSELLTDVFRKVRYKLLGCTDDVRVALEWVKKNKIGVLFLDADIEGVAVSGFMSSIGKAFPDFTIVLMTAKPTKELVEQTKTHGAAGLLLKPLKTDAASDVLSRIK